MHFGGSNLSKYSRGGPPEFIGGYPIPLNPPRKVLARLAFMYQQCGRCAKKAGHPCYTE